MFIRLFLGKRPTLGFAEATCRTALSPPRLASASFSTVSGAADRLTQPAVLLAVPEEEAHGLSLPSSLCYPSPWLHNCQGLGSRNSFLMFCSSNQIPCCKSRAVQCWVWSVYSGHFSGQLFSLLHFQGEGLQPRCAPLSNVPLTCGLPSSGIAEPQESSSFNYFEQMF